MIRPATARDIPELAQRWYNEKAKTCFSQLLVDWTVEGCATFLMDVLYKSDHCLLVADRGKITASIGGLVSYNLLPPHPLVLGEWMWWGDDKKDVVRCMQGLKDWGRQQGAKIMHYVLNKPGESPTKFLETYRWEVL